MVRRLSPIRSRSPPTSAYFARVKGVPDVSAVAKAMTRSLQCPLENVHLNRLPKGPVPRPREVCNGQEFEKESGQVSRAATVHKYNLHAKLSLLFCDLTAAYSSFCITFY